MNALTSIKLSLAKRHPALTYLLLVILAVALAAPASADRNSKREKIRVVPDPVYYPVDVEIWTNKGPDAKYCVGEEIEIYFRTNTDAYVAVFDTDTRGETHRLFPNRYDREHYVRGGKTYSLPVDGYRFKIEGPAGYETLKVVAAPTRHELREAVAELIYDRHRPATYGERYERGGKGKGHKVYVDDGYTSRHEKIVVVPDEVAYDSIGHYVTQGCHHRHHRHRRPWYRR